MPTAQESKADRAWTDDQVAAQLKRFWQREAGGAEKYRRLGEVEKGQSRRRALLEISRAEERHAKYWSDRLVELGHKTPRLALDLHDRITLLVAKYLGIRAAMFLLRSKEREEIHEYQDRLREDFDPPSQQVIARLMPEEIRHLETIAWLSGETGIKASYGVGTLNLALERWYTSGAAIRNLVFGANDGLVSTLSLVSGVAGATDSARVILVAGLAGLIAGAISMAAGAYLSVRSQREVFEEALRKEAEEIAQNPEEEREELKAIYRAKGFSREEVDILVSRLTETPERWLKTMATEELGLSEESFESPYGAGLLAGASFAVGAVLPIIPYAFSGSVLATVASILASMAAAFGIGALKTLVTNRHWFRSGMEVVAIGGAAAAITYFIGTLFEVPVG
jgi:VIT1/CCC1 family predicted Fe2+/Mn2+ transporter/demethoxyubiquinone hydroxylase (CLK1/Coq7/Cat5 family)